MQHIENIRYFLCSSKNSRHSLRNRERLEQFWHIAHAFSVPERCGKRRRVEKAGHAAGRRRETQAKRRESSGQAAFSGPGSGSLADGRVWAGPRQKAVVGIMGTASSFRAGRALDVLFSGGRCPVRGDQSCMPNMARHRRQPLFVRNMRSRAARTAFSLS